MTLRAYLPTDGDPGIAATTVGDGPGMIAPMRTLVDPHDIDLVRTAAAGFLRAHRDAGAPRRSVPARPSGCPRASASPSAWTSRTPRSSSVLEERGIDGSRRRHRLEHRPPDDFHVVVIGAGVGGINAAINLAERGIPFTVLDKNDDVGDVARQHLSGMPGRRAEPRRLHSFGLHYPSDLVRPAGGDNRYLQRCVRHVRRARPDAVLVRSDRDDVAGGRPPRGWSRPRTPTTTPGS